MAELFKFPREGKGSHRKHFDRYNAIFFYPRLKFFTNIFSPVQGSGPRADERANIHRCAGSIFRFCCAINYTY